jgi:hypothetical protein
MADKMTLELPPVQLVRQGPGTMKILPDQEHVPPGGFHLPPPNTVPLHSQWFTLPRVFRTRLFKMEQS